MVQCKMFVRRGQEIAEVQFNKWSFEVNLKPEQIIKICVSNGDDVIALFYTPEITEKLV